MTSINTAAAARQEAARTPTGQFGEQEHTAEEVTLRDPAIPDLGKYGQAQQIRSRIIGELYASDERFVEDVEAGNITDSKLHGMVALAHATGAGREAIGHDSELEAHRVLERWKDDDTTTNPDKIRGILHTGALRGILDRQEQTA